jgi:hypothetical protein
VSGDRKVIDIGMVRGDRSLFRDPLHVLLRAIEGHLQREEELRERFSISRRQSVMLSPTLRPTLGSSVLQPRVLVGRSRQLIRTREQVGGELCSADA